MTSNRVPPQWMMFSVRLILGASQMVASAVCLYGVTKGLWIGWIGALSTGAFAVGILIVPDSAQTPSK